MPCKVTMYRLRKSDPLWNDWNMLRASLKHTLSKYRDHKIMLTYDEQEMKHALLLQKRAKEKKMAN